MANRAAESPQQIILKRLLETEAKAREERAQMQQQISGMAEASRAECNAIVATAQAKAQAEAEKTRQQQRDKLQQERQQLAAITTAQIAAMQKQAQGQMDAAIALVVNWVTGKNSAS